MAEALILDSEAVHVLARASEREALAKGARAILLPPAPPQPPESPVRHPDMIASGYFAKFCIQSGTDTAARGFGSPFHGQLDPAR